MKQIRSQNKEDAELGQRVLTWLSFALRPLTIEEIKHSLAVHQPDQISIDKDDLIDEEILVSVARLVVIDHESKVIRLIHYATQDYFNRNRQERIP
jgi:hypothetical protein